MGESKKDALRVHFDRKLDESVPDNRAINLWGAGDQIRKGAALNAVQIDEKLF